MRLTNTLISAADAIELIKNGVDIHRSNILNETPLFNFAYFGNISVCDVLIQHGANVNHINHVGKTPLFMITDIEMIQFFIDHGADVNIIWCCFSFCV
jgi:ankyrin repeat protein